MKDGLLLLKCGLLPVGCVVLGQGGGLQLTHNREGGRIQKFYDSIHHPYWPSPVCSRLCCLHLLSGFLSLPRLLWLWINVSFISLSFAFISVIMQETNLCSAEKRSFRSFLAFVSSLQKFMFGAIYSYQISLLTCCYTHHPAAHLLKQHADFNCLVISTLTQ